ncbi:mitochondrial 54S ribosomal protein YmL19 [Mitosporidium daphniae]|uniref:Mitochondrial ribosomal protein L11 n=1 Tax=Mitosporidium daphniae TaxID=1485682 RepID=A0A098VMW4_9MICR|nr:uncharacterized protein DI09_85p100 [Mitosporidium daphniae]KGG50159.1 hypothetical protein DI09_85p100 [Mitosporidium daphniae]|eukprot:XP_013236586.1 uncharacterized protein DI09_85p100 [Mitosporidium daphniae]
MAKPASGRAAASLNSVVKLVLNAGGASAAPPVGPALGQRGVKAIEFAKQFNEQSKKYTPGIPLQTIIAVKADKSFSFTIRPPTTSYLLKKASGLFAMNVVGSTSLLVGQISPQQLYEISKVKATDPSFAGLPLEHVFSMVTSCARAMGLEVVKFHS